ncbi:unnamed protein product [Brassica rapa]|uniref:F-box protein At3g26010-like beta-propeller domain-containing protein n=1 Tax=Brassica campestris TaxID=3711 RepID=A0A3P6C781_BRACM|nr:unnamed protein product [Brassica rapa]VDD04362.1 unnamed protein product [Brassica rapa]
MCIYSSETRVWTSKIVHCSTLVSSIRVKTLNGTVYFNRRLEPNVLVSHDFYSESDHSRVVPFPEPLNHNNSNDVLTTSSRGFFMYISRLLAQKGENIFKIWRLNNDESWQLLWEMPITGYYFLPVTMHPFDSDIVYLWCYSSCRLVPFNLRTQKERILRDDENQYYFMNRSIINENRGDTWRPRWLMQSVLPRWMESVPCLPQVEMIDTTSLPSSFPTRKRNRDNNDVF